MENLTLSQAYAMTAPGKCAVYGGGEPELHKVARYYRRAREMGYRAAKALEVARAGLLRVSGYPRGIGRNVGTVDANGLAWVERPADIGLRFVGFADELAESIGHQGWFTDDFQESVYRGAVYQFPARKRRAIYVAGYRAGASEGRRGWSDMSGEPAAHLDLRALEYGRANAHPYMRDVDKREVALLADSLAENDAEKERDYREACQLAREWQELHGEAESDRAAARELIRDIRQASRSANGRMPESICRTLRASVKSHLRGWRDALARRAEIADSFTYRFRDPAGEYHCQSMEQFAAANF